MLPSWLYHCNNTIVATVLSMIQPWPWFYYCKCPGPIIITVFSMIQSGSLLTVQVNSLSQYFHCNSPDLVIATAQSLPHLFANDTTTVLSFWQCWNPIIDADSCCYSLTMATILSMSQSSRFFSHVIVTDRQLFKGLQHCYRKLCHWFHWFGNQRWFRLCVVMPSPGLSHFLLLRTNGISFCHFQMWMIFESANWSKQRHTPHTFVSSSYLCHPLPAKHSKAAL